MRIEQRKAALREEPARQTAEEENIGSPMTGIFLAPWKVLQAARRAVPAVDYAIGAAGIAAAGAIATYLNGNGQASVIIFGAMLVAMLLLFIFARLVVARSTAAVNAGIVLLWAVTVFFCIFLLFTTTAVAFGWPSAWGVILGLERAAPTEAVRSHAVTDAIRGKWIELQAESGSLGPPLEVERPTFDGIGRAQRFQGGTVSWHPETGPHAVWGLIGERWLQIGREKFGYPITDELPTSDGRGGRFNHFRALQLPGKPEASIFWMAETGAHEIYGVIRAKWAEMGWERSTLGYPTSPEHDDPGGRIQRFEGGSLFWSPATGVVLR